MTEICEVCGRRAKKDDLSWYMEYVVDPHRKICKECAKPLVIEARIKDSQDHPVNCACHSCQVAIEEGFYKNKLGTEWLKRPTVICKSANLKEGCGTCQHSVAHILSEKGYCNYACNGNRTVGCENV